ncbi:hypothetical protein KKA53_04025 [Candidatus Dependentiae bacterium]|nr:hypothetical protein [Candidatus Dependentiae bacterium]
MFQLNKILPIILAFILSPVICHTNDRVELPAAFNRILDTMWQATEEKFTESFAALVKKDINETKTLFVPLAKKFLLKEFEPYKIVNRSLLDLCITIAAIDKATTDPKDLRPRHARRLKNSISELGQSIIKSNTIPAGNQQQLKYFVALCSKYVLPCFSLYIGTDTEKTIDSLLFQPIEFCRRNWWWLLPTATGTGITLWKGAGHLKKFLSVAGIGGAAALIGSSKEENHNNKSSDHKYNPPNQTFNSPKKKPKHKNIGTLFIQDGLIFNSEDREFGQGPITERFVKQHQEDGSSYVRAIQENYRVNANSPDDYTVCARPSLNQRVPGPCPYYTLFNIICLHQNHGAKQAELQQALLNRNEFNLLHQTWIASATKKTWLDNIEIQLLILKAVPELCQINGNDLIQNNISVLTYNPNNLIDSLGGMLPIKQNHTYNVSQQQINANIRRFRKTGDPQYAYIFTGQKPNARLNGIQFSWDGLKNSRLAHPCAAYHTIAAKIEWTTGQPMHSNVLITVIDSHDAIDNRFSRVIHWLHHLFVHQQIDQTI